MGEATLPCARTPLRAHGSVSINFDDVGKSQNLNEDRHPVWAVRFLPCATAPRARSERRRIAENTAARPPSPGNRPARAGPWLAQDRSRRGSEPISSRNTTDLGAELDRSRRRARAAAAGVGAGGRNGRAAGPRPPSTAKGPGRRSSSAGSGPFAPRARGGTRTPMIVRSHGPEPCASTNSATRARSEDDDSRPEVPASTSCRRSSGETAHPRPLSASDMAPAWDISYGYNTATAGTTRPRGHSRYDGRGSPGATVPPGTTANAVTSDRAEHTGR